MSRTTRAAGVLAVVFLVLHLPFLPPTLEDLDSINFALGIRDFNVAEHQPHPPGYPLFILAAKAVFAVVRSEVLSLGLLAIVSGTLGVMAVAALFRRLAGGRDDAWPALLPTMLAAGAPLYWFTAARPLSDLSGLAPSVAIQALALGGGSSLVAAAFFAGLAAGIRSQVVWLTVPLLAWLILRSPAPDRVRLAGRSIAMFAAGALIWFVPLLVVSGGPAAYWKALASQGTEDLTGVQMLWTNRTPRQLILVFLHTFVAPWGHPVLAGVVLTLAVIGFVRMAMRSLPTLAVLIAGFGPYLVFDIFFQESITTRYALPLVVPFAYLAVQGARLLPDRLAAPLVGVTAAAALVIGQVSVMQYASLDAPAFRMLEDMRQAASAPVVLAMHRREAFDFRRPIVWTGAAMPPTTERLASPPKREWLEAVDYWNKGGRQPVWFVADPLRSDLSLVDQGPRAAYRWPLTYPALIGGARPNEMDWYVFDRPSWYLGRGWALTPETTGVSVEDHKSDARGAAIGPIQGWIRRRDETATVLIGGRNLTTSGTEARLAVRVDGRPVDEITIAPGFFMKLLTLPAGALDGAGDYATIELQAQGEVAVEQFDAQSPERIVFGFGDGWHEKEYDPIRGTLWRWMSERGTLRVRGTGQPHVLTLSGVTEHVSRPSRVVVRAGDRVLAEEQAGSSFAIAVTIPGELLTGPENLITIETDQVNVPAELDSSTQDRRRLGLKIFECRLDPVSALSSEAK